MMTTLSDKMVELQSSIFKTNFYVPLYVEALKQNNMSTATVDQREHSVREIVRLANSFWFLLPDSPAIRTPVFFQLCSIAETDWDEQP